MTFRAVTMMFAIVLGICACATPGTYADIVVETSAEAAVEKSTEEANSLISVPEPTTFGIVSVGIAICGGLLIRNKRTDV